MMKHWMMVCGGLLLLGTTTACAPPLLIAGAAAGAAGAAVVSDRRTAAVVIEDQKAEIAAADAINDDERLANGVHVSITSYNRVVLLTGQVPSEAARQLVIGHVRGVAGIRSIHDHINVAEPTTFRQRSRDSMTTARVKSALLGEQGLSSIQVKVVTNSDIVYLMGMIRRSEAEQVAQVVQQVEGVRGVVLVFEYRQ